MCIRDRSTLWGTGGAARAAVPAYFPSASEYALSLIHILRFDHLGGPGDAFFAFSTYNGRYTPTEERTLDHNPPEPKWEHTNFLTEKLKPEQQGLGFNEGE